jgi:hypothetical protein
MYEVTILTLVVLGVVCFIAGQLWGHYSMVRKAKFMSEVYRKSFDAYQEAIGAIITQRGLNYKEVEADAMKWTLNKTMSKIADHIKQVAPEGTFNDNESKSDKGNGGSGPSVH